MTIQSRKIAARSFAAGHGSHWLSISIYLLILPLISPAPTASAQDSQPLEPYWWNDRVFYQIFVRSFQDSDGDGIGDFQGIIDRLDYLNDGDPRSQSDLGVTGIWLMPPAEARSTHGYDTTDYYAVESDYGTIADLRRLIAAAHERGIAVIIDMTLNHSSSQHPWFLASRRGERPYSHWYIWADEHPGYVGPWGAPAWHRAGDRYYYGVFWDGMPDFNLRDPGLTRELEDIATFWLRDIGVDGFRLDAIKHLIEVGDLQENRPEGRRWLSGYEAHLEAIKPNSFSVGEIYNGPSFVVARYVNERSIDVGFDFKLAREMISAAQRGSHRDLARAHRIAMRDYPMNQFAAFLTNHDQDRLAVRLLHDMGRNKAAAALLLTGPGVPFIYYGEEIGMAGSKPDERIRTPMQWANDATGGFSDGDRLWQPLQAADNLRAANVADQRDDPDSLLSRYRDLIHLRNDNSALRRGDLRPVSSSARAVYAFVRQDPRQRLLLIINLGGEPVTDYALDLAAGDRAFARATLVYGDGPLRAPIANEAGGFDDYRPLLILAPYSVSVIAF